MNACDICSAPLQPLIGGEIDPDTGAHEAECVAGEHGTQWIYPEWVPAA